MTTTNEILRLRDEAASAGDLARIAVCDLAIDGIARGLPAVELLRISDYRASHSTAQEMLEAHAAGEDVWVAGDKGDAMAECERVMAEARAAAEES